MTFQIGSVLLDACVLAILAKEDKVGGQAVWKTMS